MPQSIQPKIYKPPTRYNDLVIGYIQESVIAQDEVVELRALRLLYVKELDKNGFPSPDYRSENLKAR